MDHHYVPQFYLREWADPDGQIPNYRWVRNQVVFGRLKSTKGTGFEKDLYSREHVAEDVRHIIETDFFSVLDHKASLIHARFLRMERFTFTRDQRIDWSIFLAAAHARTPDRIVWLKKVATEIIPSALDENPEEYERALGSKPKMSLREWTATHAPDQIANAHLRILMKHLTNEKLIQIFMDMEWTVHPVPSRQGDVLTCDRPLWFMETPEHLQFTMMMPLSPRHVFIASKTSSLANELTALPPRQFVRRINESMFNNADERVYGRSRLDYATKLFRRAKRRA